MMPTQNKTTWGGAVAALGTFLFGAPIVFATAHFSVPGQFLIICAIVGFILQGVGVFLSGFFAKDYNVTNAANPTPSTIMEEPPKP